MSDDLREREPLRDRSDFPEEEGTRSDHAGTGTGIVGPAPSGGDPERHAERVAEGPAGNEEPPGGMGTAAGGGHGTGSDKSSGGSGEGETVAGEDPETDWLREAGGGQTPSPTRSND
jgi:hypothetical protein